jgi:putative nucleotidyltransferase with HDIG domain
MKLSVSKMRSKKAKSRAKNAEKASILRDPSASPPGSLASRVFAGCLAWLTAMVIIHWHRGFSDNYVPSEIASDGAILLVVLVGCAILLRLVGPALLHSSSRLLLLLLVSAISLLPIAGLLYIAQHPAIFPDVQPFVEDTVLFLLPLSLAPLLGTILIGGNAGMAVGVWISCVAALMVGSERNPETLLMGLAITVVAVYFARKVRKRSTVFRIGFIVAFVEALFVVALTVKALPTLEDPIVPVYRVGACLANGVFTSIVILLMVPILEALFKTTTDITLLEMSDLGHPLLQRLALEAPGTYHHSLVVANLAQAAADEIGANSLLARVCAYFHDIGKLTKPDFFAENIQQTTNPHDDLTPSMSTLVITAHVKEGVSLAMLNKLPPVVVNVIRQHHGTGLVQYFHHKARQQLELQLQDSRLNGGDKVDENDFRYPGPKPGSAEAAIISLADSVEAASRSLEKASAGHIEGLVEEVVNGKILDGQLDECGLTLDDLRRVKQSFVFTLTNMLHGRIAYPKDENIDKQPADGTRAQEN